MSPRGSCRRVLRHFEVADPREPLPPWVAAHLAACPRCRAGLERRRSVSRLLSWYAESLPLPEPVNLPAQISDRLEGSRGRSGTVSSLGSANGRRAGFVLAGLALLLLVGGLLRDRVTHPTVHQADSSEWYGIEARPRDRQVATETAPHRLAPSPPVDRIPSSSSLSEAGVPRAAAINVPPFGSPRQPVQSDSTWIGSASAVLTARPAGDLGYLNPVPSMPAPPPRGSTPPHRTLAEAVKRGDDFVVTLRPSLAMAGERQRDRRLADRLIAEAIRGYERDRRATDPRLSRAYDLAVEDRPLGELARELSRRSRVDFAVDPAFAERRVTVFQKGASLRSLMRRLAGTFGWEWRRERDANGRFHYRLARHPAEGPIESERCDRHRDAMLLAALDEVQAYLRLGRKTPDEWLRLAAEPERADPKDADRRRRLLRLAWNPGLREALEIFSRLSPDRWVELRRRGNLTLHAGEEGGIPPESIERRRRDFLETDLRQSVPPVSLPPDAIEVTARLLLVPSGSRRIDLRIEWRIAARHDGRVWDLTQANGVVGGVLKPSVPSIPSSLRAACRRAVTVTPDTPGRSIPPSVDPAEADDGEWVSAGDFHRALARVIGMNVLADDWTRVYPKRALTFRARPLGEILRAAGEAMDSEVSVGDGFVAFRRLDDYAAPETEAPHRLVGKWVRARERRGALTLDDLAEMAGLPEAGLRDPELRRALRIRYGLREWELVAPLKRELLFYACLRPEQRRAARSPDGLNLGPLDTEQRERLRAVGGPVRDLPDDLPLRGRFHLRLRPAGSCEWDDWEAAQREPFPAVVTVTAPTRQEAETGVTARLRDRRVSEEVVSVERGRIKGPQAGINMRLLVNDRYRLVESDGREVRGIDGRIVKRLLPISHISVVQ